MTRSSRDGMYADVWAKYGQKGFGIPDKAPHVGSFPLYPIEAAGYALMLISSPVYDKKTAQRAQIAERALAAHPSLKPFWKNRKMVINTRMGVVEPDWSTFKVTKVDGKPIKIKGRSNPTSNLATPKQVLVRATSESELIELIPVAEDALLALGATGVTVQPIQNIDEGEYTVLFIVEGLGGGKRWSSTQKTQFRRLVSAFLPSQIREPNFQNASEVLAPRDLERVGAALYGREYGLGMQTPDSDRTRRSKRKSRAMRKVFRRPNPLN